MITDLAHQHAPAVSPDVGIVHRLDPGVATFDHPRLATAFAELCDTTPLFGSGLRARAGGAASTRSAAATAAVGEAIERYSAVHVPVGRIHRATVAELAGQPSVGPQWLRIEQHTDRLPVEWVPGWRLRPDGPGEPAWIAASRAYLAGEQDAAPTAVSTSTGLAAHREPWAALLAALLEVIERDAVMVAWACRSPVRRLESALRWPAGPGELRFDRAAERYELFALPSPADVPVVLAVALGGPGQPPVAVGAAADLDLARAARRALVEARQTFDWATRMAVAGQPVPAVTDELEDLADHVAYYLDPARLGAFDFLLSAVDTEDVDLAAGAGSGARAEPQSAVRTVLQRLVAAGLESFAVDVTAPDVRRLGWWVVRAVVPGLYPLVVGRHVPEHPRLPRDLALAREPHPFP